jgi:glutamate racemase
VLATRSTLASRKFAALRAAVTSAHQDVRFSEVACDGLAASIERCAQGGDGSASRDLLARYLGQLGELGAAAHAIDTLVLGCTHYPLIREQIQPQLPLGVYIVDSGLPVARHARRLLHSTGLLRPEPLGDEALSPASLRLLATGSVHTLHAAAQRWLRPMAAPLPDVETLAL